MKPKMKPFTVRDFETKFPNDDVCLEWLKTNRWPDGITCPTCQRVTKHHKVTGRPVYACDNCGHHLSPMAGTILEKTATPLKLWFYAMFLMASTRCGISAKQLERELGVTYKTAWRIFKQIRSMLTEDAILEGSSVEVDETYIGGIRRGKKAVPITRIEAIGHEPLVIRGEAKAEQVYVARPRKEMYGAWSSVDGELDVISVRRHPSFVIYEHGTQHRIRCTFPDEFMERVKNYLGFRVIAEGFVRYREDGVPVSLSQPTSLERVPEPKQQDISVYRGSLPGITGGMSSYEYVRQLRESDA